MVSHFVPSVAFLSSPTDSIAAKDQLLQRTLFDEDDDAIDAPLGRSLFAHSPFGATAPQRPFDSFDEADEDQWLDEVATMRDQIEQTRRSADVQVRHTERQAARLAEVMSRKADGRVATARRWAAQEAHRHEALAYEEGREWANMVAHVKAETADVKADLADARGEKARLKKQLEDAALRREKEQRAEQKAREAAVSQARQEAEAATVAQYSAAVTTADERTARAEARLASTAAEWAERLAAAEARAAEALDLRRVADERVAAEFKERIATTMVRSDMVRSDMGRLLWRERLQLRL
jgi:hypothetical protein